MILQVKWSNQQRHSTEGQWLVNWVKGQSTRLARYKLKKDETQNVHTYKYYIQITAKMNSQEMTK